ncbi:MAG TPA: hypothetical protein VF936_08130 [Burkholderiales bacterium]
MSAVDSKQRAGAMTLAISITLSIVWALSSYAYGEPPAAELSQTASKTAAAKSCS